MGVSISKSNSYLQMRKKSKNRQASKEKLRLQNNIKKNMEGTLAQKGKDIIVEKSQKSLRIQGKRTIQSAALPSQKSIDMHMNTNNKQNIQESQVQAQSTSNKKMLKSLKKSLHFAQKSPFQDDPNQSPTEQFTKAQTMLRKHSKTPSSISVQTKHGIQSSLYIIQPQNTLSVKSIGSRKKMEFSSNPVSSRKIQQDPLQMNDWKSPQQTFELNGEGRRIPHLLSINISNRFGQMGSHMQERRQSESFEGGKHAIPSKILAASKRLRAK